MGGLSTHVLDTALGKPGSDILLHLYRVSPQPSWLCTLRTNRDGRTDQPLLDSSKQTEVTDFALGIYELRFEVTEYFSQHHPQLSTPYFFDEVTLRFRITDDAHYHIPLLLSPWSYSTYRGS